MSQIWGKTNKKPLETKIKDHTHNRVLSPALFSSLWELLSHHRSLPKIASPGTGPTLAKARQNSKALLPCLHQDPCIPTRTSP